MTTSQPFVVTVAGKPRQIKFTGATLLRIEKRFGAGLPSVLSTLQQAAGVVAGDPASITEEARTQAIAGISYSRQIDLLAACLNESPEAMAESITNLGEIRPAFNAAFDGVLKAVGDITGVVESAKETKEVPSPAVSAPSPA